MATIHIPKGGEFLFGFVTTSVTAEGIFWVFV
jgi:hypothetical protein